MSETLKIIRDHIDQLDATIVEMIAKRQSLAMQVADIKKKEDIQLLDEGREEEVVQAARSHAQILNVSPDLAEEVMRILIKAAKDVQEEKLQ